MEDKKSKTEHRVIYPVILSVPASYKELTRRERVKYLSRHARRALKISAEKSGIQLGELLKENNGSPMPSEGNYWSVTHKPDYVGGVIDSQRIGIDIEKIRPCSPALFKKIADDREWALSHADPLPLFFRYWTAKEAVLKAGGKGLTDLSHCRIVQIIDDHHLAIKYKSKKWFVEQFFFSGHMASVIQTAPCIKWIIL
ncbi:MAG: 4'-phosphopantetheinyl transferase superfamily protein [Thermodesulfobacteriota bacterium]|nr:4'-phosphopantetheinyl transferase superfamily protein [Thermodesulfobacteriota bacterium]